MRGWGYGIRIFLGQADNVGVEIGKKGLHGGVHLDGVERALAFVYIAKSPKKLKKKSNGS